MSRLYISFKRTSGIGWTGRDRYRVYTGGLTVREGDRLNQFAFAVEPDGTLRQLKQLHEPINA